MIKIISVNEIKGRLAKIAVSTEKEVQEHVIPLDFVIRFHLEQNKTITKEQYRDLIKTGELELLYNKMLRFIDYQMRTISEVKKKLRTYTLDEQIIQQVVDKLKEHRYVGDKEYVHEYVSEKLSYDVIGPIRIKEKLIQKGIHYDLIDSELIRFTETIEQQKIEDLLHKELRIFIKKPYRKFVESFKRKCVNKGFHVHIVENVILNFKELILEHIDEKSLLMREMSNRNVNELTYEQKQKLLRKLTSKGFSYQVLKKHLYEEE
jgi:regulatory protein